MSIPKLCKCGGVAIQRKDANEYVVYCMRCGIEVRDKNYDEAIKVWNEMQESEMNEMPKL